MSRTVVNARVTFRNSPIHVMEQFTFRNVDSAMQGFRMHAGLDECVIVQTCNRVEMYGAADSYDRERIERTWASLAGLDASIFRGNMEICDSTEALAHLLRVTAGLDSMVIGEEQVLGQVRQSIHTARESGSSGETLNTLFDRAIKVGTRVRQSSQLSSGGVSVGSMAVRLAEAEHNGSLAGERILLIGTGELSTLVAKSLRQRGYEFGVASRTFNRARLFCESLGGNPVKFEDALADFGEYSVMFVATTAPYFMVTAEKIRDSARREHTMILDLSNPRTVDERVADLDGVKLVNLDEIASMVDHNIEENKSRARNAEEMITEEIPAVETSMRRLDAEPIISEMYRRADMVRKRELEKALGMLEGMDEKDIRTIENLTRAIMDGTVSEPVRRLRDASEHDDGKTLDAARRIWDISD